MPAWATSWKKVITYLPVVARNGTRDGRHGQLIVDAVHVLVVHLRDRCACAISRARKAAVDSPSAVWRSTCRVVFGWRLFGGALCPSKRSGDAQGLLGGTDRGVVLHQVVRVARRGGRDVHGRACGRVLRRLSVCVLLVRRMVCGNGSRRGELGCHGVRWCVWSWSAECEALEGLCGGRRVRRVPRRNGTDKGRLWRCRTLGCSRAEREDGAVRLSTLEPWGRAAGLVLESADGERQLVADVRARDKRTDNGGTADAAGAGH
jgi:hypothetical protein